ncbi:MAG: acetyl-CoA C-acyltransferase, partial [Pseudomonadota bacterium]|nr:acetyl-CoA C-acyltransferase [Pseudomonadota bacterium]
MTGSPRSRARPVYVVDGARTPFIKARGRPGPFSPADLAVQCGRPLLLRQPFGPDAFDTVILGCANQIAGEMNVARVAALRLGCGDAMPAWTVHRNCGSGMQSLDDAFRAIAHGDMDLVLAGGTEALSMAPLVLGDEATEWLASLRGADGISDKLKALKQFQLGYLSPEIALKHGLTDPVSGLDMGQTAEVLAHRFGISRWQADEYALETHRRLARAQDNRWLDDEIEPMFAPDGTLYEADDGVRRDSSIDGLIKLSPVFEPYGDVTAGNASQVTDGACWMVLASEAAVEEHGLTPHARICDSEWSALDPAIMGLAPVLASTPLMDRAGLGREDIDLWEINEAFAVQVLACL